MENEQMREYTLENNHHIDVDKLRTGFVDDGAFSIAHSTMCFVCHDVLVRIDGKYLLVNRDNVPAKDILWPLGGRVLRGVPAEESLRNKVRKEAHIELSNIRFLGVARTLFETDPWGHGRGTDTLNLMYVADGKGKIELDQLHSMPHLISKEHFTELRSTLHPYVIEMFERAMA